MRIVRWDAADDSAVQGCLAVWRAARAADAPDGSPKSAPVLRAWLRRGWSDSPGEVWLVPGSAGIEAYYRLALPQRENLDHAPMHLVVHPAARRRGLGTGLLRHAAERAAANGRALLRGEMRENSAGEAFARYAGADRGLLEVIRVLDVSAIPADRMSRLRETAARAAAGYSLVTWTDVTPGEYLERAAAVREAMNDAPHNDGVAPRTWDGQRLREAEAIVPETGVRAYTVAAMHDASGEMAALTQVSVDPEFPEWGIQGLTAVTRPHRGHRLGMLTKATMVERLAEAEPKLQRIETGNAASNKHMIAINEELGFTASGRGNVSYTLPVASVR